MKIFVKSYKQKKLMAVVNSSSHSIYLRVQHDPDLPGSSVYFDSLGSCHIVNMTLESLLKQLPNERIGIYEGDEITLKF